MRPIETPGPATPPALRMGALEWAMLLLLSLLWGGSFFFVGIAVRDLPTLSIVALRVGMAAVVLWVVVGLLRRPVPRSRSVWAAFLGMGVLNNVIPFGLIVWGQHSIASGLASILNATTPLFTVAVAGMLLVDERMTRRKLAGLALGLTGVAVMIGPAAVSGMGQHALAQLACLGGALSYGCAAVFGRRFRRLSVDPIVVAAAQVVASALLLAPAALIVDAQWTLPMPPLTTWAALLGLAVLSTAAAYVLYFHILQRAGATSVSLVTFLIPVSAIALGVLVLGERLTALQLAGMALIAAGLLAIDGRIGAATRR